MSENEGGLPVQITVVEELGSDAFVYGTSGVEGTPSNVIIRVNGRDKVHKGETHLRHDRPAPRARVRHRHRGAAQRLSAPHVTQQAAGPESSGPAALRDG